MKLEMIGGILAIVTTIGGGGAWIHSHAQLNIDKSAEAVKSIAQMNQAEIQLHIRQKELEYQLLVPKEARNEYQNFQVDRLHEETQYWTDRVRNLEAKQQVGF